MFLLKSKLFDGLNGQQHSRPPSLTNLHLICLNKFNVFVWRRLLNSFHLYSIHGNQSNIRLSTPLDGFTCCTRNHAAARVTCRIPFSKNKWINEFVKIQVNYGKFLFDSELIFKNWMLLCDIHLKIDLVPCFCLQWRRQKCLRHHFQHFCFMTRPRKLQKPPGWRAGVLFQDRFNSWHCQHQLRCTRKLSFNHSSRHSLWRPLLKQ